MTMRQPITLDSGFESLPTIHDVADDDQPITPERALWLSVIANCWADAFERSDHFIRASETAGKRQDFDPDIDVRLPARRWLTLTGDCDYARDRLMVCEDLAEISEPMLRNAAKAKLAQVKDGDQPTAEVIEIDRLFSMLVDNEATMDPADIDAALEHLAALEAAA